MDQLKENAPQTIERLHASWLSLETAGQYEACVALCADDVELWALNEAPLRGRAAVLSKLMQTKAKIHSVEISNRRIQASSNIACLTANFKTTFSLHQDAAPGIQSGSHLWILRLRADIWEIALITWTLWDHTAASE